VSGAAATAPLVWGGTGFFVKGQADPFAGIDPKGKIVVIYSEGLPRGMDFQTFRANRANVEDPITHARKAGAVGVITLTPSAAAQNWDRTRRQRETGGNFQVDKLRVTGGNDNFPVVALSPKASDALLAGSGVDIAGLSKAYPGSDPFPTVNFTKSASLNVTASQVKSKTQNVVAIWEGSDPKMKDEMVAVGAHYDHVGNAPEQGCRPIGNDSICNGADDDGSGTVAVLSMAEALAKAPQRPKRSVLFVWHCGEEKGLWGSEYFNKYPTVDVKKVIAQLNIDMIGRSRKADDTDPKDKDLSGENAIYVIGKDMMSSTLGNLVSSVNSGYLKLDYDTRYDDPKDPNRFFFRSDHFNYALNGIPITFWFDGVHVDYHQVGDEPDKIDYQKMEKVTRTILTTLWELTAIKDRPKIDKQLPTELSQR
ncbi:MAG TPA: M20/M25/M40 family metallo-hydrolase, partial [Pyrinomonadaceae bacterium]|nr:M20/M25/M40 family metallo-hydrolase [Pyrinomonadaceae bacterium]